MADEPEDKRTIKEKLLFYTTAFFILLGTFSLFAFLFLVPFVIDPAFTTIFMQFDTTPALCFTVDVKTMKGVSNCSWTSCKEGCTKELYECTQIYVNYKLGKVLGNNETQLEATDMDVVVNQITLDDTTVQSSVPQTSISQSSSSKSSSYITHSNHHYRMERKANDYDEYSDNSLPEIPDGKLLVENEKEIDNSPFYIDDQPPGLAPNTSEWHFFKAQLYPNVKGCGYPPMLNCTIWSKKYKTVGSNYSCFYSQVDPKIVISDLDLHQNTLNLVYAMAIPIPSFIISVIYLTFAYFKIYNEDEETQPLDKNAEGIDGGGEDDDDDNGNGNKVSEETNGLDENEIMPNCNTSDIIGLPNGSTILHASAPITPNSDLASFGHQLKVKMVDEMSRGSIDGGLLSNSASIQGNLSKTMTTSISTPPGPIAAV